MRAFLERNKIYFETVTATALTAMAVFLSWNSIQISKAQRQPFFVITDEAGQYALRNDGSPAANVQVAHVGFLDISAEWWGEKGVEQDRCLRTIASATLDIDQTGKTTGVVAVLKNAGELDLGLGLSRSFSRVGSKSHPKWGDAEIAVVNLLRVSYIDIFGADHADYLYLDRVFRHPRLDRRTGRALFEEYRAELKRQDFMVVDYQRLDAGDLARLWMQLLAEGQEC